MVKLARQTRASRQGGPGTVQGGGRAGGLQEPQQAAYKLTGGEGEGGQQLNSGHSMAEGRERADPCSLLPLVLLHCRACLYA